MSTPVSGPGQFSKRTDKAVGEANRSLPNAEYGEQAAYQEQQQGAPMADAGSMFSQMFGNPSAQVTPLGAESSMPDVPVTDGAALGAGAGPEALSSTALNNPTIEKLRNYLPALQYMADAGDSDAARNMVRQIQAMTM